MYVLGLNSIYHESAACLLHDGELVAFSEEERFNRRKHAKSPRINNADELPWHAIDDCLRIAGIDLSQVRHIGYSSDPQSRLASGVDAEESTWHGGFNHNIRQTPQRLADFGYDGKFTWVEHHLAHAASAFFPSPFADAAVMTVDGIGDTSTTSSHHGVDHQLRYVQHVMSPNSIGFLWELISMYLGFDIYDATKIMGLAAYGDPARFRRELHDLVLLKPDGRFTVPQKIVRFTELDYATPSGYFAGLEKLFATPKRSPGQDLEQVYKDVSAALQEVTDELLLHIANHLHKATGSQNLCLAGGVALNCVTNQQVLERGPFQRLYVQPAAHDAGTAIGCAYHIWHQLLDKPRGSAMHSPYWGPEFSNDAIESVLRSEGVTYQRCDEIELRVARLISEGNVVGYFQGRMEVGPRALGNRSLLADPRQPNMRDMLNEKVKHREFFRPFAPSVLHEEVGNWFQIEKPTSATDFMLMAYPAHEALRDKIPAVIHVDGTSRLQTVRAEINPRYHRLISEFQRLTGVPIVLNTSFNDSEPIVCSPRDALHTFMKTKIDFLAIGDFLLAKSDNPGPASPSLPPAIPMERLCPSLANDFHRALARHRLHKFEGIEVLTDSVDYDGRDQVLPLFAEQQFFVDQLNRSPNREKIVGGRALEIGVGSGVLSIMVARSGAEKVTALEVNPRAKTFAGFNIMLNGCEDKIDIREGSADILQPVDGQRFRFIFSNPPFVPSADGSDGYLHSAAGHYGLEFIEQIFRGLDQHLTEDGWAQFVLIAPGNQREPFLLRKLAEQFLTGATTIHVNPEPSEYVWAIDWLCKTGQVTRKQGREMLRCALADGVSHIHLCVVEHVPHATKQVTVARSARTYPHFEEPTLGLEQPECRERR